MNIRTLLLLYLLAVILFTHGLAKADLHADTSTQIEQLKVEFNLPSLSVAVGIGDEVVFAQAIGFSDLDKREQASVRTQYSVGSLAKPMTGLALAKLVDLGKVELDSSVSTYVKTPSYTETFTVAELAAHLAGVPHDTPERDIAEFKEVKDHVRPSDAFYVFDHHPLLFEPGTEYKYSSNGYILLSAVIENAANSSYVDFLRGALWDAFEMQNTELDTSFAGKEQEATYYSHYQNDAEFTQSDEHRDRSFLFGGGGFISTPSDLVIMSRSTYDTGYLSDETRKVLTTPVKLRSGIVNDEKYSLGWRVGKIKLADTDEQVWTALHHGGVTDDAATSYLLVVPQCKASIAFATNHVPKQFWRMRGPMAKILKTYIDKENCA